MAENGYSRLIAHLERFYRLDYVTLEEVEAAISCIKMLQGTAVPAVRPKRRGVALMDSAKGYHPIQ